MTESAIVNEWLRQGEVRGALKGTRRLLLRLLNKRFPGAVPADVAKLVNEQDSLDLLNHWFDTAVSAATFDEFLAALSRDRSRYPHVANRRTERSDARRAARREPR